MKIVVCIKQVPSTNEVKLDPVTNTIIRSAAKSVINPFDTYALEEAITIKEKQGGEIVALSMGIPATESLLRDACSRGADRAVLISGREFAGADTYATSYALSLWIRKHYQADLIICGKMAVDGDTAQIGPELAEWLKIPQVTNVAEVIKCSGKELTLKRLTDNGFDIVNVTLPALITVVKDINLPRMPSIAGVRAALAAPFECYDGRMLGADNEKIGLGGSPTQVVRTFTPKASAQGISIEGTPSEQAQKAIRFIKEVR